MVNSTIKGLIKRYDELSRGEDMGTDNIYATIKEEYKFRGDGGRVEMLTLVMCTKFRSMYEDLVQVYKRDDNMSHFRFFYLYYVVVTFVFRYNLVLEKDSLRGVLEDYFDVVTVPPEFSNRIMENFDYLYDVFFRDHNIYFSVYFNNLIKYFLPLPVEILEYSPLITYRATVSSLYKKDNRDYLAKITKFDLPGKRRNTLTKKNADLVCAEVDMHLPLKYFDRGVFDQFVSGVVFLVGTDGGDGTYGLHICGGVNNISKSATLEGVMWERQFRGYDSGQYNAGLPFETISPVWRKPESGTVQVENIVYISVMRKMVAQDLYNVFGSIDFDHKYFRYLYHATPFRKDELSKSMLVSSPRFFTVFPDYRSKYVDRSNCVTYRVNNTISGLLDLTDSIITNSPLNIGANNKRVLDRDDKKWMHYRPGEPGDYYGAKPQLVFHENYRCVTPEYKDISVFVKDRPYCDVNNKQYYSGRRRLQEILYKTRKYDYAMVWPHPAMRELHKKFRVDPKKNFGVYHYRTERDNLYEADIDIMNAIGDIPGFYFTDYEDAIIAGGELYLKNPDRYVTPLNYKRGKCSVAGRVEGL